MRVQTIEYRVSADAEFLMAGLTEQILDILVFAMRTIANQGMDGFIDNQVVGTFWIGTEIALRPDRSLSPTLPLTLHQGMGACGNESGIASPLERTDARH
jgi:hypothetical protein